MRCVIFDLDGTLADTSGDLIAAANACFQGLGHGDLLNPLTDQATALRGGRAMLELGFARLGHDDAGEEIDAQFPVLLEAYRANIDRHSFLYPGATEAIERLRRDGYAVGICTNKPEALAELLMTRLGVRGLFGSLVGADTLAVRKPDPAPLYEAIRRARGARDKALLVGDTITDRSTARAAGVPCVLVTFGPTGGAVASLAPEALLPDYDALSQVVSGLIG